jgi:hypothetical protein
LSANCACSEASWEASSGTAAAYEGKPQEFMGTRHSVKKSRKPPDAIDTPANAAMMNLEFKSLGSL